MGAGNLKQGGGGGRPAQGSANRIAPGQAGQGGHQSVIGIWEAEASATAGLSEICIKAVTAPA